MNSSRDIRMLMRYSHWANSRLYEALHDTSSETIHKSRTGRPGGMIGTLSHIYVVDLIWKGHLEGKEHGFKTRNLEQQLPFEELREAQRTVDEWYISYVDGLSDRALVQVVDFKFVDGGLGNLTRGDMLLHISNHKTYHRGYLADMLYESGAHPPTVDLPVFIRDSWRADGAT